MGSGVRSMAELSQLLLNTTEIMEIVLVKLRKDDLMRVRRVCRRLRVVIDGTPYLQPKLFLAPEHGITPRSVGFAGHRDYVYIDKRGYLQLRVHDNMGNGGDKWTFKIGTYYRRMFLVQPPIKSVVLNNYHCRVRNPSTTELF